MIDMCKTTAQGYEMATKASQNASKQFWIAVGIGLVGAVAAAFSAAAAWVAVGGN